MTINWKRSQERLNGAGYSVGTADGIPGRMTYTGLFAYGAQRQPDAAIRAIGQQAAKTLPTFGISDHGFRLAEFIAETCHESGRYTSFEENLKYSAKRLMAVWPSRFKTLSSALPYAWDASDPDREDTALANLVYGSRMGNELNGTSDDDGWLHRGRGLLQHTGAGEYAKLKQRLGIDPDDLSDPATAVIGAADYWSRAGVNPFCDRRDWRGARKAINGGDIGLEEIAKTRDRMLRILA